MNRNLQCLMHAVSVCCLCLFPWPAPGADWHVSPKGLPAARGSPDAPWDIASALDGTHQVQPNDTVWIHGGYYKFPAQVGGYGYLVKLAGREGAPIQVRPWQKERVTIDGGLNLQPPSTHLWIWDLEIRVSEPRPGVPVPPDPTYKNVNRPWGGLNVYTGANCKFINLIIHDNSQGVSWWSGSRDSEMHGCILYDNGWAGTDRGHGHAIYTQNKDGVKTISDCIFTGGYGYTLHAYGSIRADVNNYLVEGTIAYNAHTFLIGGGKPSHGIQVISNCFYQVPVQLGYSAQTNEDCELRGNLFLESTLSINRFSRVVQKDNAKTPELSGLRVILRPNKFDPQRANLAVFNPESTGEVQVDLAGFLSRGDKFRLLNPRDFFGSPVLAGTADGSPVRVPVHGPFACFVLLKGQ